MRSNHTWTICLGILISSFLLAGCNKGEFETATVRGTVYCNGEPMEGGQIIFYPQAADGVSQQPGKPASGGISGDGTFELGTYGTGDGAVIGRCRVVVYEPGVQADPGAALIEGDEDIEDESPPQLACDMSESDNYIVEVKPGDNEIKIELPRQE